MSSNYLKKGNIPTLIIYLIWNVALFLVVCNGASDFWDNIRQRVTQLKARDSLFCFLTPLALTIACGFLPASWKASLVFWRIRNALPGCRAFSELAKNDPRIDESRLKTKLANLPTSPRDENAVWYRCYKMVQNQVTVQQSHRQFLLNRDLTGISFLFLVFGTLAVLPAGGSVLNAGTYAAITMLQYVIFSIVARNHGNRFVCNVLVEYQNRR
jgi:hypothetical protein